LTLSQLAFACYLYGIFTDFDESFIAFLNATNHSIDLTISEHRHQLLTWLNSWGCRQFAVEYHNLASKEISSWYNEHRSNLPRSRTNLWELTEPEFISVRTAFESLSKRKASIRKKNNNRYSVSVGPTGASKILFAIRPKALIPWDAQIRQHFKRQLNCDKDDESYIAYHREVIKMLDKLKKQCESHGLQLINLPKILNRPNSSIPKLIDEYHWVTITNNSPAPSSEMFQLWINLDQINQKE
jgi:hypothetical protein